MKLLFSIVAGIVGVSAHTTFTGLYIDGIGVGDAVGIRMSTAKGAPSTPIKINSNDLVCNVGGSKGVDNIIPVKDGATLSFEFRAWSNDVDNERKLDSIAKEHYGPCAIYAKKVDNATTATGAGDGWFKLWEDGYDETAKLWCNQKMNANNRVMSIKLPVGLQGGDYLFRPEMLALQNAVGGKDPQFYTGCAQVRLESTGKLVPKETVTIPGYIKTDDPGVTFNVWDKELKLPYPIPGPKLATLIDGTAEKVTPAKLFGGQDCIGTNANFCMLEVPEFTDKTGCWASAKVCWNQIKECWASTKPTGGDGCKTIEKHCTALNDVCTSGQLDQFVRNKDLTADKQKRTPVFWGKYISGSSDAQKTSTDATDKTESADKAQSSDKADPASVKAEAAGDDDDDDDDDLEDCPADYDQDDMPDGKKQGSIDYATKTDDKADAATPAADTVVVTQTVVVEIQELHIVVPA